MAQSRTPYLQTDETKRFDLAFDFQSRDGTFNSDSYMENVMVEFLKSKNDNDKRIVVQPRPGLGPFNPAGLSAYTPVSKGAGMYYWSQMNGYYWVSGSSLYFSPNPEHLATGSVVTTLVSGTVNPTFNMVGWAEFQYANGTYALIMSDGVRLFIIDQYNTVTSIGSGASGLPSFHIPTPVFMDGYLFIIKYGTSDIWNCNLNDPTTWSGAFITAEMYGDNLTGLSVNNNFLYAIGTSSIEFFYDAGNAVGTPLQRYAAAVLQFGSNSAPSIVASDTSVFLVGDTNDGGYTVYMIDGFKPTDIGNPAVKAYLKRYMTYPSTAVGSVCRYNNQKYYLLTIIASGIIPADPMVKTLVYSIEAETWTIWSSGTGGSKTPFIGLFFANEYALSLSGVPLRLGIDNVTDYNGTTNVSFECNIITSPLDFGIYNKKRMSRFSLLGGESTAGSSNTTFNISWNDYDYNPTTWTTSRQLNFINDFPSIAQLGIFRRRAFKINCIPQYKFRLEGAEVDISKGNQ